MSDVLSPEQIAELVAAAKEGGGVDKPVERTRRPRRVRELDFTRPVKLAPDQARRLERAHETFCRTASTRLSAELRSPIEFEIINVDQLTWSAALADVPQPSIFGVLATKPAETAVLVGVELPLVFRLIERLIGGGETETTIERNLTDIEIALTRRTFVALIELLSGVWDELFGLRFELLDLESQVANVEIAPTSEPTVVITIEVRGERASSTISLLIPYRSIASVSDRLSGQFDMGEPVDADETIGDAVRTSVGAIDIEVRAEVGAVELTIGEVLALTPGDVLKLGSPASGGVFLCAGDVRLHRARPGRSGTRRAVEIVEQLESLA
ncbi:MAG: surface presentation of antigen protein [Actinomycetia bacterium]|jgi:flagellar motor switch protein FliM|nr:surface presentation of antigen protein [Actinomycetes bacterium]